MLDGMFRTSAIAVSLKIFTVVVVFLIGAAVPASAQVKEESSTSSSYQQSVRLVPKDTIPQDAYQGWKQYELNCSRCHGEFGVGSSFAPALIESLRSDGTTPDQASFLTVVCQGRKDKGMPSWCEAGMEMGTINNIYSYLKLRADGKVGLGRPAVKSDG